MWAASAQSVNLTPVLSAALPVLGAVLGSWWMFRGKKSETSAVRDEVSAQREQAFDAQVDADRTQLRARVASLEEQTERLASALYVQREKYATLRLAVINHGLDPDLLIGDVDGTPRPARKTGRRRDGAVDPDRGG